jgi:tetratricopeptide (TPR) repeat protein
MSQPEAKRTLRKLVEAEGYLQLGMPKEALEALEAVTPVTDFEFEYYLLKGLALRDLERFGDALVPLEKAAQRKGDDVTLCLTLGWCLKRTDQLPRAIAALHRAQQSHPDEALLQYNLACYYSLAGERASAVDWLKRALALSPEMRELIPEETDFDALRGDPQFEEIAGGPFLA